MTLKEFIPKDIVQKYYLINKCSIGIKHKKNPNQRNVKYIKTKCMKK